MTAQTILVKILVATLAMYMLLCAAACDDNAAIKFAHKIEPKAQCDAIESQGCGDRGPDRAVCRVGDQIWTCVAGDGAEPECRRIRYNTPAEVAP